MPTNNVKPHDTDNVKGFSIDHQCYRFHCYRFQRDATVSIVCDYFLYIISFISC